MNIVDILIKATDGASGNINKVNAAFKSLTGFTLGAAGGIALAGKALQEIIQFTKEAIEKNDKYVTSIVDMARFTGDQVDQMSRLVQVADDAFLSQEQLNNAMSIGAKKGLDMSVEGIKKLADEYNSLKTVQEKNQLLNDNFGRSGLAMGKLLEQGSVGITKNMEAIEDNLVVTNKSVEVTLAYKKSVDQLNDSFDGIRYTVAQETIPLFTAINIITADLVEKTSNLEVKNKGLANSIGLALNPVLYLGYKYTKLFTDGIISWGNSIKDLNEPQQADADRWIAMEKAYKESLEDMEQITEEEIAAMIKEQDKLASNMITTTESMQSINDNYKKSLEEIAKDETLTAEERIIAIKRVENEHLLATRKIILSYAQQILAADGLTTAEATALLQQGVDWGIYSQTAVDEMMKVINEAGSLAGAIGAIPTSKDITIITHYNSVGSPSVVGIPAGQTNVAPGGKPIGSTVTAPNIAPTNPKRNAMGGSFVIPSSYGYEGFNMGGVATASPGETVNISRGDNMAALLSEMKSVNDTLTRLPYTLIDALAKA